MRTIGQYTLVAGLVSVELALVVSINTGSALTYLWFLLVAVALARLLIGPTPMHPALLFAFYAAATLILFLAQRETLPEYQGFSGGFGVGTDDSYYYSLAAHSLPADFPARPGYHTRTTGYSTLLRAATPGSIRHPLDALFFNAAWLTLLPFFTFQVARRLSGSMRVSQISAVLVLICPFVLSNGVLLTRDGLTATLFVGVLALFLERRYVAAGTLGAFLFYLRLASGLQLAVAVCLFAVLVVRQYRDVVRKAAFAVSGVVVVTIAFVVLHPAVIAGLAEAGFLTNGLFRTEFIAGFIALTPSNSVLEQVSFMPALLRTPISVAYFLAGPFMGLDQLTANQTLVPRAVASTLFALLSIGYMKFFVQGVVSAWWHRNSGMWLVVITYLLLITVIAHFSLLIRHKTMLMPLFYVIVGYGVVHATKLGVPLGNTAAAGLLGIQLWALMDW